MPNSMFTAQEDRTMVRQDVELLWHERRVEVFGGLQRVSIPLIASGISPSLATELSMLLTHWWVERNLLAPAVRFTSVAAEVQEDGLGNAALVLLVTADQSLAGQSAIGLRVARDVRRALRDVHRRWAPSTLLAA